MGRFNHARAFPTPGSAPSCAPTSTRVLDGVARCRRRTFAHLSPRQRGRYYLLPIMDMWTDVFAAPGTRTTGGSAIDVALTVPSWRGELPEKMCGSTRRRPLSGSSGDEDRRAGDYRRSPLPGPLAVTPLSSWGPAHPWSRPTPTLTWRRTPRPSRPSTGSRPTSSSRSPPRSWSATTASQRLVDGGAPRAHRLDARAPVRPRAGGAPNARRGPAAAQALLASRMPRLANVVNGWQMNLDTMGAYGNST